MKPFRAWAALRGDRLVEVSKSRNLIRRLYNYDLLVRVEVREVKKKRKKGGKGK